MPIYDGKKSRAPLIPLEDESKSTNGELLVKKDDSGVHLLISTEDESGIKETVDIIEQAIEPVKQEIKETKQFRVDEDEPVNTHEQIWFRCQTFDNDEGTMRNVTDYEEGETPDQL